MYIYIYIYTIDMYYQLGKKETLDPDLRRSQNPTSPLGAMGGFTAKTFLAKSSQGPSFLGSPCLRKFRPQR